MQQRPIRSRLLPSGCVHFCALWLLVFSQFGVLPCLGRQWALAVNDIEGTESESSESPVEEEPLEEATLPSLRWGRLTAATETAAQANLMPPGRPSAARARIRHVFAAIDGRNGFGGHLRC
jgi:hypothetical protein